MTAQFDRELLDMLPRDPALLSVLIVEAQIFRMLNSLLDMTGVDQSAAAWRARL